MKSILLFLFLAVALNAQVTNDKVAVFRNVTVIDMKRERPMPGMTVVISGDRIARIGRNIKFPANAYVVDASGKYMIPGLWDMHVHLFNNRDAPGTNNLDAYAPQFIANGVTGVRDMWTDTDDLKVVGKWMGGIGSSPVPIPRISVGSAIVDGVPVTHKNSLGVSTPDEARLAVKTLRVSGAGFIKVYENLSRDSYLAIADQSRKLRIAFAGHVPNSMTAAEASNAGQKSIEHLTRMLIACSGNENKFRNLVSEAWTPALRSELLTSYSEQKCIEVSKLFAKNRTWQVPTLVLLRSQLLSDSDDLANDQRLRFVPSEATRGWANYAQLQGFKPANRKNREARFQKFLDIVKVMYQNTAPLLAGTDLGNPYVFAGFSLHDELELLVRAGLSPFAALEAATINPAKYLGYEKALGTVETGKIADLVLLDANPLSDISNTRKISAVMVNGRLFLRGDIDRLLIKVSNAKKREKIG